MTNEEALAKFDKFLAFIKGTRSESEFRETFIAAREALKKGTTRGFKVVREGAHPIIKCDCGVYYSQTSIKYCSNCGQKLCWEVKDGKKRSNRDNQQ